MSARARSEYCALLFPLQRSGGFSEIEIRAVGPYGIPGAAPLAQPVPPEKITTGVL